MLDNENITATTSDSADEITYAISDLLYTLFATLDEYTTRLHPSENVDGNLTKMSVYVDEVMRKYAKILYDIDLEPTDYDYMSQSKM